MERFTSGGKSSRWMIDAYIGQIFGDRSTKPNKSGVYMRPIRTNIYPRTEGWTGKQGNGIVTNRIIINIGGTSKQRDQCFSGIEVDKLITGKQYSGSYRGYRGG